MRDTMEYCIDFIKECCNRREIYVWGAWERGKALDDWLRKSGLQVYGYIDSSKRGTFNNRKIYFPDEVLKGSDAFVLLSVVYHKAIENILESYGKVANEDYVYLGSGVRLMECQFYQDVLGNKITGKITDNNVSLAFGGHLNVGKNVWFGKNPEINVSFLSSTCIGDNVSIGENVRLENSCGSSIKIGKGTVIGRNVRMRCENNSSLIVGNNVRINDNAIIIIEGGSCVQIGNNTSFEQYSDLRSFGSTKIILGDDCMVSYRVRFRSHNGHTMIDKRDSCVYETKKDCILGDHVWVGTGALLMPGTKIGDGTIIGANSFLDKKYGNNLLIAGTPGRVFREEVDWDRKVDAAYEEWNR